MMKGKNLLAKKKDEWKKLNKKGAECRLPSYLAIYMQTCKVERY